MGHMSFETTVTKYCMCCHALEKAKLYVSLDEYWFNNNSEYGAYVTRCDPDRSSRLKVRCDKCGSAHTVLLDNKIAPIIAKLNEKGYATDYSCDGEVEADKYAIVSPYIAFTSGITPADIFYNLPENWYADYKPNLNMRHIAIYYENPDDSEDVEWDQDAMLQWVDTLPYNDINPMKIVKKIGEKYCINDIKQAFGDIGHLVSDIHELKISDKWIIMVYFLNDVPVVHIPGAVTDGHVMAIPVDDITGDSIYQIILCIYHIKAVNKED